MTKEICWNITALCNQSCKYCHRFLNLKNLSYEENLKILYNLIDSLLITPCALRLKLPQRVNAKRIDNAVVFVSLFFIRTLSNVLCEKSTKLQYHCKYH